MLGARQRILRATTATLSWQPQGSDGEAADPGLVTVAVVTSAGTVIHAAGTATSGTSIAARTVALTAAQTAALDILKATWTASGTTVAVTHHDIVGGYYFTATDLTQAQPSTQTTPVADLLAARAEVETSFESWTGMAFVPRFDVYRTRVTNSCRIITPHPYLRAVRWVRFWSGTTSTDLDSIAAAAIPADEAGIITLPYSICTDVEVGFEHGLDSCPYDIKPAAMHYTRVVNNRAKAGIPDRALSMVSPDGASYQFGRIGTEWRPTGIEPIDEVLRRPDYDHRSIGVA